MPEYMEIPMRGIAEKHIQISTTDRGKPHGQLWVRASEATNGLATRQTFRLDTPWQVKFGMNYWTLRRLCRQIARLGIDATHIELYGKDRRYRYCTSTYREIFDESNHVPIIPRSDSNET